MAKRKKRKRQGYLKKESESTSKYVKRYALAGMYDDNTVGAAGQGGAGSTANIVFDESNPTVLQNKLDFLKNIKDQSIQESSAMAVEIENQKLQDEQAISDAAAAESAKFTQGETLIKAGLDKGGKLAKTLAGKFSKTPTSSVLSGTPGLTPPSGLSTSLTVPDTSKLTLSGLPAKEPMSHLSLGADKLTPTLSTPELTSTATDLVSKTKPYDLSNITVSGEGGKQGISAAIKAYKAQRATNKAIKAGELMQSSAGTAVGAGWKALGAGAKANIIGTAATVAGEGLKKFGGDEDETELNTAEWAGESLAGIGTGIGAVSTLGTILGAMGAGAAGGSVIPLWGTIAGGVAGLGYGLYKAVAGRNKARKAEKEAMAERAQKVGEHNKAMRSKVFSALAGARAGEVEQKTYSGYDLGRNVDISKYGGFNFRNGGMKMGVPRYGFKPA